MRSKTIASLLAALALLCGAAVVHVARADDAPRHFLWKVTGGKGVVYLFGTVHVGKADFYPLPQIIEDSFKQADTLVEEVDSTDPETAAQVQRWVADRGSYPAGDTVRNHLSAETSAHLGAFLKKSGQTEAAIARLRPWLTAMLVIQSEAKRLGLDAAQGLDRHFLEEASQAHKPVKTLESANAQLQLFTSLPDELQDQLLLNSLLEAEQPASLVDVAVDAWKGGNVAKLHDLMDRMVREHPRLKPIMALLFENRNDAMAAQIETFLATPETYFVAIGAGHLVGDRGILSQLRAKNFSAEQL
jgi:hypothetical protein